MSFEVFLGCYCHGELSGISRQQMKDLFGNWITREEPDLWRVEYDSSNRSTIYLTPCESDPSAIGHATVSRPAADPRLWDSLFQIMKLGNVVLYYPGCRALLVAEPTVASHLPADMIESLGTPVCVHSGAEIVARIRSD